MMDFIGRYNLAVLDPPWHSDRCRAVVYKRDTYRRTGRGKSGFSMYYSTCQCSRRIVEEGLCRQHLAMKG